MTEAELRQQFLAFGQVMSVNVMDDTYIGSGQSRSYAFVEMTCRSEGLDAILGLNGKEIAGRPVDVIEALPLSVDKAAASDHGGRRNFNRKPRQRK